MNKRMMAALMAASIMVSFTACNTAKPAETTTEATTEATTTAEEATTTEETTEETTTSEETTTTEEPTVTEESVIETSATATTANKPTAKAKKSSAPSVPKGYKKLYWGKKYGGHKVYIVYNEKKGKALYMGWWKNKWVTLWHDEAGDDYEAWEIQKPGGTTYYEVGN